MCFFRFNEIEATNHIFYLNSNKANKVTAHREALILSPLKEKNVNSFNVLSVKGSTLTF